MSWADNYIKKLQSEGSISFRPRGNSMSGKIESGQLVTVVNDLNIAIGDIVLCKVKGNVYLHLVKSANPDRGYLIGNNKGKINGWTKTVFGRVTSISA